MTVCLDIKSVPEPIVGIIEFKYGIRGGPEIQPCGEACVSIAFDVRVKIDPVIPDDTLEIRTGQVR